MRKNKQVRQSEHGEALKIFFDFPAEVQGDRLYLELKRVERKGNFICTQYCNGDINETEFDIKLIELKNKLAKIIPLEKVFFNTDPRGYFLKIKEEYSKDFPYRDWGGYGIIAPEL